MNPARWLGAVGFAVLVAGWVAFVCGCQPMRIFEKKVPVADSVAPAAQIEGQRQAAAYIAKRTAPPLKTPGRV